MKHILNVSVLVLLLVLTIEAAGINRSLRRIEHEQRRFATHKTASAWYLMRPPLRYNVWDVTAPFSQWGKIGIYTTERNVARIIPAPSCPCCLPRSRPRWLRNICFTAQATTHLQKSRVPGASPPPTRG